MILRVSEPVAARYGQLATLALDQIASESVRLYGEWAEYELRFLSLLIGQGDWVLDVGAYIGTHTLAFAAFAGPSGQVIAFEPRQEVFSVLEENASRLNTPQNVTIMQCALGAIAGELRLPPLEQTGLPGNPGGAALRNVPEETPFAYKVAVRTIDSLDLRRLDLLKLDVEGAEFDVIAGAALTIRQHRPIIYAEANSLDAAVPLLECLRTWGYAAYGCIFPAFNPDNYRGNMHNIFGDAAETALLFVPGDGSSVTEKIKNQPGIVVIDSLDSLALLLLHKPQYPIEVLRDTAAGCLLGLDFPTVAQLKKELQAETYAHRDAVAARDAEAVARKAALAARDAETVARKEAMAAREAETVARKAAVAAYEDAIQREADCRTQLTAIYNSRSWRLTAPIRRAMSRFSRSM